MTTRRTARTGAALSLLLAVTAAACGVDGTPEAAARPRTALTTVAPEDARPSAPIDDLVPVGASGARLHLRCEGSGPSTVVLISGFTDGGDSWGAVTDGLIAEARVCSYARFGTGTSDAPTVDQRFSTQAADLHDLLQTAGEPGPYVLAGHSFGGAQAVAFADAFADEVRGIVLLDATPTSWPDAACAVPDDGSETAAAFGHNCDTIFDTPDNVERLDGRAAFAEVARISTLGDLPMRVVTAAHHSYPGLSPDVAANLERVWNAGQDRWATLSSDAVAVPVQGAGHYVQVDQPAVVIDQIRALLDG